ncbi:hypothetical protein QVD17_41130 [Tagetes erecta]|uniref:Uncharacterized protein n=1 Tax=Tagetes erecta TaxID=13708 RepID=A0AAD8JQU1_TARER|nr:hypothetical protein QVD17_41130 [Tagetes erecta]
MKPQEVDSTLNAELDEDENDEPELPSNDTTQGGHEAKINDEENTTQNDDEIIDNEEQAHGLIMHNEEIFFNENGDENPNDKHNNEEDPQPNLPYLMIIVIRVYGFCGTAFSSAPYAVYEGGWLSLILLVVVSTAALCSSLLIRDCLTWINFAHSNDSELEDIAAVPFKIWGSLSDFGKVLSFVVSYVLVPQIKESSDVKIEEMKTGSRDEHDNGNEEHVRGASSSAVLWINNQDLMEEDFIRELFDLVIVDLSSQQAPAGDLSHDREMPEGNDVEASHGREKDHQQELVEREAG